MKPRSPKCIHRMDALRCPFCKKGRDAERKITHEDDCPCDYCLVPTRWSKAWWKRVWREFRFRYWNRLLRFLHLKKRYHIPFTVISSEQFEKTEQELMAAKPPITNIIEAHSLKDRQQVREYEDEDDPGPGAA
jgi:hypothetical protein